MRYEELEQAYEYANADGGLGESEVCICRSTGRTIWLGEGSDDEIPDDLEESDDYISLPTRYELDLGRSVAIDFADQEIPRLADEVRGIFSRRGAYGRFKALLAEEGMLERWYAFEGARTKEALLAWAEENDIPVEAGQGPVGRVIDGALFAAAGPRLRQIRKETVIAASPEEVFAAWTDGGAFSAMHAPDLPEATANIELAIGGLYEWLWDGKMGSNGCQVLSYVPDRMLSFSWNAPPDQPESRAARTWVVVEFEPVRGGRTHVTLTHLGFGEQLHWADTFEYFSEAWPRVLARFKKHLESVERP